jgi:hypothetical protein
MNIPRAAAGAIDAMRGANHFVKTPAVAITIFPLPIFIGHNTVTVGKFTLYFFEKGKTV